MFFIKQSCVVEDDPNQMHHSTSPRVCLSWRRAATAWSWVCCSCRWYRTVFSVLAKNPSTPQICKYVYICELFIQGICGISAASTRHVSSSHHNYKKIDIKPVRPTVSYIFLCLMLLIQDDINIYLFFWINLASFLLIYLVDFIIISRYQVIFRLFWV